MTEDELRLWERYEAARDELISFYLPIVDGRAKHLARITGRDNWEDLRQDGSIGLMKAIERFHPSRGVEFRVFAKQFIRGAILDGSELTRNVPRPQQKIYRTARRAEQALTKTLHRNPTVEEIAKKTRLTIEQIRNAFAALGLTNPEELKDQDDGSSSLRIASSPSYTHILIEEASADLSDIEKKIIRFHYLEGMSHEEIAEKLEIIPIEVTRIRQRAIANVAKSCTRAIAKLRKRVGRRERQDDENRRKGSDNETKESGK